MSTPKTRGKSKTGQSYAARLIRSFSKVQHLSSSESDDQSEKDTEAVGSTVLDGPDGKRVREAIGVCGDVARDQSKCGQCT